MASYLWQQVILARGPRAMGSPPDLGRINGFGNCMVGDSDRNLKDASYTSSCYFTMLFVPVWVVGVFRVQSQE